MLRAVMIDGFGWFQTGDFRRAWLLFDEVDYVFPAELRGDMWFPPLVRNDPWYRVQRPSTSSEDHVDTERWLAHDAEDPAPALSILTSKLLIAARQTKAVPIVGKQYAWTLLAAKLSAQTEIGWDTHSRVNAAAFAAGLSLQRIDGLSAVALASVAASIGAVAAGGTHILRGMRRSNTIAMAYVFEANRLLTRG